MSDFPEKWQQMQDELQDLFDRYNVNVDVGLTGHGIAIRSQTNEVDVLNIGELKIYLD